MLYAIKKIGEYIVEKENLTEEESLIQRSKLIDAKKILCIVFKLKDDKTIYYRINIEEDPVSKARRLLYRTFTHGHYDVTPTTRFLSPEKVKKRTLLWFREFSKKYNDPLIKSLYRKITKKSDEIFEELSKKYDELNEEEKRGVMFTIKIIEGEHEKYLGEYAIFKEIFKKESLEKFFAKHKVESKGEGICHLCSRKTEVLGFASPFSFSTFDKPGFAPILNQKNSWKALPICAECAVARSW